MVTLVVVVVSSRACRRACPSHADGAVPEGCNADDSYEFRLAPVLCQFGFRAAAEDELAGARAAIGSHHNEIGSALLGSRREGGRDPAAARGDHAHFG